MPRLWRQLVALVRARQLEAELREEIESHRALRQEQLERAGLSQDEALCASRRALGNTTLAREEARAMWVSRWLDGLRQDVAYAWRGLARAPGFAVAMIGVTALGIGASTSVFGLLDALVLRPLPVHEPARLVYFTSPSFSYPIFAETRARTVDLFSGFFAWSLEQAHVDWSGELEPSEVLAATGDMHATLGVKPALGRTLTTEDDRQGGGASGRVATISHAAWMRRFNGDPAAIGRTIAINSVSFTIVGVTPRDFFGVAPGLSPDVTIPVSAFAQGDALTTHSSAWLHLMGRLRDGVSLAQAQPELQVVWPQVLEATTPAAMPADRRAKYLSRRTSLAPGFAGYSRVRNSFSDPLWMLFGLVGLLFAVACASASNLLLARGVSRRREIAVRLAIGAGRGRVIRQLITESFVWTGLAASAGMLIASWAGSILVRMMTTRDEPLVLDVAPNWRIVFFVLALTVLTVALCSIVPALRTSRLAPRSVIQDGPAAEGRRRWHGGQVLIAAQVALTVLLLIGAGLFVRSLLHVLSTDAGFDARHVLVVAADPEAAGYEGAALTRFNADLQARVSRVAGVASSSLSMMPPISDEDGLWTQTIAVDNEPAQTDAGTVYFNAITPGYFATLSIRLQQGRDFTAEDAAGSPRVVAINESLARRFLPGQNPLGRSISIGRDERRQHLEIIAIVGDTKYQRLEEPAHGIAYLPLAQAGMDRNLFVEVRPAGAFDGVNDAIRRELKALDPRVPVRIERVTDRIRASLARERVMAALASTLGSAALILACAALYGLMAYAVTRRTREIGLRLALGATRAGVVWPVLRSSVLVTIAGSAAGIVASFALGRYAASLLHGIGPTDAFAIAGALLLMVTVSLLASLLPAVRASRIDPAQALRGE
ncbi:MAG TPA: ABC transporter permease [Vicinamibacterales bacterium]|nr:ABC transporter permease [Vicinamibacterales bacterium]